MAETLILGAGETLRKTFLILPGESCDLDLEIDLRGEGGEVDLRGLYLCPGDEKVNIRVRLAHSAGSCISHQDFRGIAGGSASVTFDGRIVVAVDAQKTEAYQESHGILLSDRARIRTLPQLEIYADDVKCSHGATTGRLDEAEQFYMRSRGIPEAEAKRLQIMSFLSPVTATLSDGERAAVEKAIDQVLS